MEAIVTKLKESSFIPVELNLSITNQNELDAIYTLFANNVNTDFLTRFGIPVQFIQDELRLYNAPRFRYMSDYGISHISRLKKGD